MNKIKRFFLSKSAQLGMIEFQYLMIGLVIGLILGIGLVYAANKGMLPFKLTFVCPTLGK